jgi:tetratricopeptide (TPR) repeat protein
VALLLLVLGAAGGVALWQWWRGPTPQPPEVALDRCEPAVAAAIEAARAEVLREPRSGAAWGKLGRVLLVHDLAEPALPCFVHAERFDPDNPRWPYFRALILQFQDPQAALPALRQAADLCDEHDPGNTAVRLRLAEALAQLGRLDEAIAQFKRVLYLYPDDPRARYGLGLAAAAAGDLESARDCFQGCSASPQARKKAAAELARVLMRLGDRAGAAAAERQGREAPPDRPWTDRYTAENGALTVSRSDQFRLAREMIQRGKSAEGLALLRRLVAQKPDHQSYLELGVTLAWLHDSAGAAAALRQAARLDPSSFRPVHLLNILLLEQAEQSGAQEPLREAVAFGRQAVALKPDNAFAHVYLGLALQALGQRPEALAAFRTAVRCAPDKADAYLYLAEALAEEGHRGEARRLLELAGRLPLAPDDPRPRQTLERLRKRLAKD